VTVFYCFYASLFHSVLSFFLTFYLFVDKGVPSPIDSVPVTDSPSADLRPGSENSVGERHRVSETTHEEDDVDDINDELHYNVDVCGASMLDDVLQAANSFSAAHDSRDAETDDDNYDDGNAVSQQQQPQDFDEENINDNNDFPSVVEINGSVNSSPVGESSSNSFPEVISICSIKRVQHLKNVRSYFLKFEKPLKTLKLKIDVQLLI